MTKRLRTRGACVALAPLAMGCGGKAETPGAASMGGAGAASSAAGGAPGIGPIDTTGLPTVLPMDGGSMTVPLQLALPCKVGASLLGGGDGRGSINVLECDDQDGNTLLSTAIPFGSLATLLNQPAPLPFASPPLVPRSEDFTLTGTAVFSQVDAVGRAFVARLTGARITGDNQTFMCLVPDTPFWAVQGGFT